jgi:hypothetical protein
VKQILLWRLLFGMNKLLSVLIAVVALLLPGLAQETAPRPVVVELFTSEGCSSCPPADALLMKLDQQGAQNGVLPILLGEHVDYWNYLGWTDRFSSAQFSRRQSQYANTFHLGGPYTPQMVIDGQVQFVGNDAAEAQQQIAALGKQPETAKVALQWAGNNRLHVIVQSEGEREKVLLAITEDGLSTQVANGENGGRTLHHAAVVRELKELGNVDKGKFETQIEVAGQPGWNRDQLKVIVLAQDPQTQRILGAAAIRYQH